MKKMILFTFAIVLTVTTRYFYLQRDFEAKIDSVFKLHRRVYASEKDNNSFHVYAYERDGFQLTATEISSDFSSEWSENPYLLDKALEYWESDYNSYIRVSFEDLFYLHKAENSYFYFKQTRFVNNEGTFHLGGYSLGILRFHMTYDCKAEIKRILIEIAILVVAASVLYFLTTQYSLVKHK